jgi:hypothetical protein
MSTAHRGHNRVKRKKVHKVATTSQATIKQVVQQVSSPATAERGKPAPALSAFIGSIVSVRSAIKGDSEQEQAAREGLDDLAQSLRLLRTSQASTDPNTSLVALQKSNAALQRAKTAEKRAGDAWPF